MRCEPWLFAALVVAQALAAVAWPYLPTWDGPAHVASAVVLSRGDAAFAPYFRVDLFPLPNVGGHLVLTALVGLGVPPLLAEKLLFAGLLVGLPFAQRALLLAIGPGAALLTYFALPFAINWFTYSGFYNFTLGLVVFLLTVRCWARAGAGRVGLLALWLLAGYLCHVVTFGMTLVFLAVQLVWTRAVAATSARSPLAALWADGSRLAVACAPTVALCGLWLLRLWPGSRAKLGSLSGWSWTPLVANLATLRSWLVVFRETETLAAALLTVTVAALTAWALWRLKPWRRRAPGDVWLVAAGASLLLYFAMPLAIGNHSFITERLCVFPWLGLLCWLAQAPLPRRSAQAAAGAAVIAAVALTGIRLPVVAQFNRDMAEFLSAAPLLPPGATVVPLYFVDDREGHGGTARSARTRPMQEAAGYLMATRRVVDLSHYESAKLHFPTRFRPEMDPIRFIGGGQNWIETVPPRVDLLDYEAQTPGRIDFVLVWGLAVAPPAVQADPATEAVKRQLAAGYLQIFASPRGLLQVYARKNR